MTPFVIFALPRSRTAWLSRLLTHGGWICGHEEIRHNRTLPDIKTWLSQPKVGTIETTAAPWWRLLDQLAPGTRVATIRRPVEECVDSYMRLNLGSVRESVTDRFRYLDRKLDQIEKRMGALSVDFHDLDRPSTCATLFAHCTGQGMPFDHWRSLTTVNVQIDMRAVARLVDTFRTSFETLGRTASQQIRFNLTTKPVEMEGLTFQEEGFDDWVRDGGRLFEAHCVQVGEDPAGWGRKNIPLMRKLHEIGAMQIMTARSNGRMFGYHMAVIGPSLKSEGLTTAVQGLFFPSPEVGGLGLKLQRAAIAALKAKGAGEMMFEASERGYGPRLGNLYKRVGAVNHGTTYRLELT